ncbi:MAG: primosomal protein N', partial [Prevotellaceae bacterium]|nr:primosomal protein N' [Prevotellaceae bacterium]
MFADVILPLALPKLLSYSVPHELETAVAVGLRVAVQLGRRKVYAAIVQRLYDEAPPYATKPILSALDATPLVNERQLQLWRWIADYYMCSLGEVMKAALPAALKMESETRVSLGSDWEEMDFDDNEAAVINLLQGKKNLSIEQLTDELKTKTGDASASPKRALATLQGLLQRQAVCVNETLNSAYKPRYETLVALHPEVKNEGELNALFEQTKRAPQQEQLLLAYVSMAMPLRYDVPEQVSKKTLLDKAHSSEAVLKACVGKKFFALSRRELSRLEANDDKALDAMPSLSAAQQSALDSLQLQLRERQVALLHGVTSSGKTEIYMHLIAQTLAQGKQALYLLPEIALTAQLINRLKKVFANVGVYHSKFSDAQRVETYQSLLRSDESARPALVLGVRSSLFLPYSNLGLVIVDEEHENTYKQRDPAPRYHARDAAIVLARMHGAKVLLGSATPSIESYYNATTGKYGLVELTERYGNVQLPDIRLVNIAYQRRQSKHFSPPLLQEIGDTIAHGEQIILFQNRRGFSPYVECKECGWIPQCEHCNVSLTYHKHSHQLVCHYCGYAIGMPHACLACGGSSLETQGFGTEKIEEDLQLIFPHITVGRMDLDTTRTRTAYERLIADFEQRKIQILVGT